MAKKKTPLKTNPDSNHDLDFNFDELGLDDDFSIDPDVDKDNRKPVQKAIRHFKGIAKATRSGLLSGDAVAMFVRSAIPHEYGNIVDDASKIHTEIPALYNDAVTAVKPEMAKITRQIDRLVPASIRSVKDLTTRLAKRFEEQRSDYTETNQRQSEEATITESLATIFAERDLSDKVTEAKQRAEHEIENKIDAGRHADSQTVLTSIDKNISIFTQYKTNAEQSYQKKSLELQYRTYYVQSRLLATASKYYEVFRAQNEAISKNTALPDYVKINLHEQIADLSRKRLLTNIQNHLFREGGFIGEGIERLKEKTMRSIADFKAGFGSQVDDMSAMSDQAEMASSLGGPNLAHTAAGSIIANSAMGKLGARARARIQGYKPVNDLLAKGSERLHGLRGSIDRLRNSDTLKDADLDFTPLGLVKQSAAGILDSFLVSGSQSIDPDIDRRTGTALYDRKTNASIVTVIPGYLARIYREIQSLRTGRDDVPLSQFDHDRNTFSDKATILKNIHAKLGGDTGQRDNQWYLNAFIESLVGDSKLSKEARGGLSQSLQGYIGANNAPDIDALKTGQGLEGLAPEHRAEVQPLIDQYLDAGHEDYGKRRIEIVKRFNQVKSSPRNIRALLAKYIKEGYGDDLVKMGLITPQRLSTGGTGYATNAENLHRLSFSSHEIPDAALQESALVPSRPPVGLKGSVTRTTRPTTGIAPAPMDATDDRLVTIVSEILSFLKRPTAAPPATPTPPDVDDTTSKLIKLDTGNLLKTLNEIHASVKQIAVDGITLHANINATGTGTPGSSTGGPTKLSQLTLGSITHSVADLIGRGTRSYVDYLVGAPMAAKRLITDNPLSRYLGQQAKDFMKDKNIFASMSSLVGSSFKLFSGIANQVQSVFLSGLPAGFKTVYQVAKFAKDSIVKMAESWTDIYVKGNPYPTLSAFVMRNGGYIDQATGQVIKTLRDIKGPVVDAAGNIILSMEDLAKGLVDSHGKPIRTLGRRIFDTVFSKGQAIFNKYMSIMSKGTEIGKKIVKFPFVFATKLKEKLARRRNRQAGPSALDPGSVGAPSDPVTVNTYSDSILTQIRDILQQRLPMLPGTVPTHPTTAALKSKVKASGNRLRSLFSRSSATTPTVAPPIDPNDPSGTVAVAPSVPSPMTVMQKTVGSVGSIVKSVKDKIQNRIRPATTVVPTTAVLKSRPQRVRKATGQSLLTKHVARRTVGSPMDTGTTVADTDTTTPPPAAPEPTPEPTKPPSPLLGALTSMIGLAGGSLGRLKDRLTRPEADAEPESLKHKHGWMRRSEELDQREKEKEDRIKNIKRLEPDLKYKSKRNVLDILGEKLTGAFDSFKDGLSSIADLAGDFLGRGKGKLGKLGRVGGALKKGGGFLKGKLGGLKGRLGGSALGRGAGAMARGAGGLARAAGSSLVGRIPTLLRMAPAVAAMMPEAGTAAAAVGGAGLSTAAIGGSIAAGAGTALAAIAGVISSPVFIAGAAIAAVGYGAYKLYQFYKDRKAAKIVQIRMRQYGLREGDEDHYKLINQLEAYLEDEAIQFKNNRAVIDESKVKPAEILSMFDIDPRDQHQADRFLRFMEWFNGRFKPIFLTHLTSIHSIDAGYDSLKDVSSLNDEEKVKYINLVAFENGPYNIIASPFKDLEAIRVDKAEVLSAIQEAKDQLKDSGNKSDLARHVTPPVRSERPSAVPSDLTAGNVDRAVNRYNQSTKGSRTPGVPAIPGLGGVADQGIDDGETGHSEMTSGTNAPDTGVVGRIPTDKIPVAKGDYMSPEGGEQYIELLGNAKNFYERMNPAYVRNFMAMAKEYGQRTGKKIRLISAWRSKEHQAELHRRDPGHTARPGGSLHEHGLAVDVWHEPGTQKPTDLDEVEKMGLMRKYGFTRPVGDENWHVEPAGIQGNIQEAKDNPTIATQETQASLGKGGGGLGLDYSNRKVTRNPKAAMALWGAGLSEVNTGDRDEVRKTLSAGYVPYPGQASSVPGATPPASTPPSEGPLEMTIPPKTDTGASTIPGDKIVGANATKGYITAGAGYMGSVQGGLDRHNGRVVSPDAESGKTPPSDLKAGADRSKTDDLKYTQPGQVTNLSKISPEVSNVADVKSLITKVAQSLGIKPDLMIAMAKKESSFNPNAKAPGVKNTAKGLFQFIDDTWRAKLHQYGPKFNIPTNASPYDPLYNTIMGGLYIKENIRDYLSKVKDVANINSADIYLAHMLGGAGGRRFLTLLAQNPNMSASDAFPRQARNNPGVFKNAQRQPRTLAEVYDHVKGFMGTSDPSTGEINMIPRTPASRDIATSTSTNAAPVPSPAPMSNPTASAPTPVGLSAKGARPSATDVTSIPHPDPNQYRASDGWVGTSEPMPSPRANQPISLASWNGVPSRPGGYDDRVSSVPDTRSESPDTGTGFKIIMGGSRSSDRAPSPSSTPDLNTVKPNPVPTTSAPNDDTDFNKSNRGAIRPTPPLAVPVSLPNRGLDNGFKDYAPSPSRPVWDESMPDLKIPSTPVIQFPNPIPDLGHVVNNTISTVVNGAKSWISSIPGIGPMLSPPSTPGTAPLRSNPTPTPAMDGGFNVGTLSRSFDRTNQTLEQSLSVQTQMLDTLRQLLQISDPKQITDAIERLKETTMASTGAPVSATPAVAPEKPKLASSTASRKLPKAAIPMDRTIDMADMVNKKSIRA